MVKATHSPFGRRAHSCSHRERDRDRQQARGGSAGGVRRPHRDEADGQSLSVSPADHAVDGDQTIEQDGATVWLDPVAADALDGMVLDGGVDEDGNIQFALGQQV
ncbi:Fe-S cluster assembly protein HesB [Nocardioides sp.]|uniref:Fe-S cluster assembly protein HesB n=1 Tax=Nocardioides sp. TaxID=35761 RepID=UPI002631BFA7|nr:Fe-S cluster assembly protein HesB [Nocardioides sp.]MCW2738496.1 Fe-S cluster assembly protein HesB [Nocardioides sp.]